MKILVDTHTHTISSGHAYSTLDENIKRASEIGLQIMAMTDHTEGMPGGAHLFYFNNLRVLPEELYDVRLLKGAETNIISYEGKVDLNEDTLSKLDYVIASLHPPCISFADIETVTSGIEKVMENPYISTIGHPGDERFPLDFERIVLKAKETGTLLEVNNASLKPTSFRPGVRENLITMLGYCKTHEVPIILGTDAHFYLDIGAFNEAIDLLKKVDFPEELVLNTRPDDFLNFISQKRLK